MSAPKAPEKILFETCMNYMWHFRPRESDLEVVGSVGTVAFAQGTMFNRSFGQFFMCTALHRRMGMLRRDGGKWDACCSNAAQVRSHPQSNPHPQPFPSNQAKGPQKQPVFGQKGDSEFSQKGVNYLLRVFAWSY